MQGSEEGAADPPVQEPEPGSAGQQNALLEQSGVIAWNELARHFARGVVITVSTRVDLIAVARVFSIDDTAQVQRWLTAGDVARASDDDARDWVERNAELRCVVAAPWVLVQELH